MFDKLSDTQFEEFCMSLLKLQGLQNVNWRKGTDKDTSPADNGRDIECEYHRYDNILQRTIIEKWFIECKHYKNGVPPEKLNGALSWAFSERPNRLIIMVSGFLSNPCKEYIKKYISENRPTFFIEIWEKPNIERMARKHPEIIRKYNLELSDNLLNYFNYYHLRYIDNAHSSCIEILQEAINKLTVEERNIIFSIMHLYYICCDDELNNINHNTSYEQYTFDKLKQQCYMFGNLSISLFVHTACNVLLGMANPSKIEKAIDLNNDLKVKISARCEGKLPKDIEQASSCNTYMFDKDFMLNIYNNFCDKAVKHLLENPY